jgi:adenylyltransferase/sulfurtransferase
MTSSTDTIFSANEWLRYTRHVQLPQIGAQGQGKLKNSKVLVIGCGGLGCPVLLYLAAAGVGYLTIVDDDVVELTNLQRQILYKEGDIGLAKADCAQQRLSQLNSHIEINAVSNRFSPDSGEALVGEHDLIIDCTDNFSTRYLINELCVDLGKPWIFASIFQFSGQCALFVPGQACFRCLYPDAPDGVADCNAAGVLGVLPGFVGTFQANEAIKYLLGLSSPLSNSLMLIETLDLEFRRIQLQRDSQCPTCANQSKSELAESAAESPIDQQAGKGVESIKISPQRFDTERESGASLTVDVRSLEERLAFHIGGEHIAISKLDISMPELPENHVILCYCQSGARSLDAAQQLNEAGFQAYSLDGGLAQWLEYHWQTTET